MSELLTLVKGIFIPGNCIDNFNPISKISYSDSYITSMSVLIPISGYLIYSRCQFDPITQQIYGKLINHVELTEILGISQLPYNSIHSFSIDISATQRSRRELTLNGPEVLREYLCNLFKVS